MLYLEELSMNAWPAIQTILYDGWILRFANGYTKRANSINPVYFSNENIHDKIEECEKIFKEKNIPIVFKITPKIFPNNLDKILESKGYLVKDITRFQTLDIEESDFEVSHNIKIEDDFNGGWLEAFCKLNKLSEENKNTIEKMFNNIISEKFFVSILDEDKIVGCTLGVLERNYVGIFDVIVDENHRNKGLGEKLIKATLRKAKDNGGEKAYLQVVDNNISAINLYKKVGFKEIYKYWYRIK